MSASPAVVAHILKEAQRAIRAEDEAEVAEREAKIGKFVLWVKRHWKWVGVAATAVGVGVKWYASIEAEAEQRVLHRIAEEAQATAVETNTATVQTLAPTVNALGSRMTGVETAVKDNAELSKTVLDVFLSEPKRKRAVERKPELAKRAKAALGRDDL